LEFRTSLHGNWIRSQKSGRVNVMLRIASQDSGTLATTCMPILLMLTEFPFMEADSVASSTVPL
jgi:hypothetical protein